MKKKILQLCFYILTIFSSHDHPYTAYIFLSLHIQNGIRNVSIYIVIYFLLQMFATNQSNNVKDSIMLCVCLHRYNLLSCYRYRYIAAYYQVKKMYFIEDWVLKIHLFSLTFTTPSCYLSTMVTLVNQSGVVILPIPRKQPYWCRAPRAASQPASEQALCIHSWVYTSLVLLSYQHLVTDDDKSIRPFLAGFLSYL